MQHSHSLTVWHSRLPNMLLLCLALTNCPGLMVMETLPWSLSAKCEQPLQTWRGRDLWRNLFCHGCHFVGMKTSHNYKTSLTQACWWCMWKEGAKRGGDGSTKANCSPWGSAGMLLLGKPWVRNICGEEFGLPSSGQTGFQIPGEVKGNVKRKGKLEKEKSACWIF